MTLREAATRRVVAQFKHPSGFWGPTVGWVMASRSSNRRRNAWGVSLLNVGRSDRVLENGFGPGIAIQVIGGIAVEGYVCGLNHSEQKLRQASKRNAAAIRAGRVDLRLASGRVPACIRPPFDKILAVNTLMFGTRPDVVLEQLRRVLRVGGRIAVAHQLRGPAASDATASAKGKEIAAALGRAGFSDVQIRTMRLKPAVVCVIGVNAPDGGM